MGIQDSLLRPDSILADEAKKKSNPSSTNLRTTTQVQREECQALTRTVSKNLSVVTIETMTGGLIPGRNFNISRPKSEQTLLRELRLNEGQKKRVKQMRDGLRRVVFGCLVIPVRLRVVRNAKKTTRKELERNATPAFNPERMAPRNHKFTLNDFFAWDKDDREIKQFINDLNNITSMTAEAPTNFGTMPPTFTTSQSWGNTDRVRHGLSRKEASTTL